MKSYVSAVLVCLTLGSPALAGGLSPTVVPTPEVIETKPASSVSPLLVIGLLVLIGVLISRDDDEPEAMLSDSRLKSDVMRVGTAVNGLPLYHYRYTGLPTVYEGVMAQDVLSYKPEAIIPLPFGYMAVDYGMLGLEMKTVN